MSEGTDIPREEGRTIRSAGSDLKWFLGIIAALLGLAYFVMDETSADVTREINQDAKILALEIRDDGIVKNQDKITTALDELTTATNNLNTTVQVLQALMPKKTGDGG